jgi:hypothetical protein
LIVHGSCAGEIECVQRQSSGDKIEELHVGDVLMQCRCEVNDRQWDVGALNIQARCSQQCRKSPSSTSSGHYVG